MTKTILALSLSALLSACAVSQDGFKLGTGSAPSEAQIEKARASLERSAVEAGAKKTVNDMANSKSKAGVVLIGDVGPFRALDADERAKVYDKGYTESAAKWHPEHPQPYQAKADFVNAVAGWTTVQVFAIPGVFNRRIPAFVSAGLDKSVNYASGVGSFFVGTTGDLVVGVSNDDGFVMLTRVLCKDSMTADGGASYRECAKDYERGKFDANTGRELGNELTPKDDGATIDVNTYKRVDKPTAAAAH